MKVRSRREVNERVHALSERVKAALTRLPDARGDADVVDAVWQAEGLGTLLWSLGLVELEPFDRTFDPEWLLATPTAHGTVWSKDELEHALETARLWHWRCRTGLLRDGQGLELPERWDSFEQLVAVVAMRGYERGLLPSPVRGDFAAFEHAYRELTPAQRDEVMSIAWERQRALGWLTGAGKAWEAVPTPT